MYVNANKIKTYSVDDVGLIDPAWAEENVLNNCLWLCPTLCFLFYEQHNLKRY